MRKIRRAARELALNILYQCDAAGMPFEEALDTALEFADLRELDAKGAHGADDAREYAKMLAEGVRVKRFEMDDFVDALAKDWSVDRQPVVDRNILRIALYEIRFVADIPALVAVDEAVELAKKFSTEESGKFVNGILAAYLREHPKEEPDGSTDSGRLSDSESD